MSRINCLSVELYSEPQLDTEIKAALLLLN